jgi:hypothetical protein
MPFSLFNQFSTLNVTAYLALDIRPDVTRVHDTKVTGRIEEGLRCSFLRL